MSLTTTTTADVLAACSTGAAEANEALSRALDGKLTLQTGAELALDAAALPGELSGPGLVVVLTVGDAAAVLAISEATGCLPKWYGAPDATGVSKLATLAQELGMLLLPEAEMPDDFAAFRVSDIAAALARGTLAPQPLAVTLPLSSGGKTAAAQLIWPLMQPKAIAEPAPVAVEAPAPAPAPTPAPVVAAPAPKPAPVPAPAAPLPRYENIEAGLPVLSTYTRSLLKIRVPIVVTLARSKQPVSRIVELAPGSIIPFAKSCDDTLSLEVNNHEVAVGEAVKVGDKFGLRITAMTLPPEKFIALKGRRAS